MKAKKIFMAVSITALVLTIILVSARAYYVAVALFVGTLLMGHREIWYLLRRRKLPPIDERVGCEIQYCMGVGRQCLPAHAIQGNRGIRSIDRIDPNAEIVINVDTENDITILLYSNVTVRGKNIVGEAVIHGIGGNISVYREYRTR